MKNTEPKPSSLARQEAGNHYKDLPIQPVEFCQRNGLGFCESSVIKYVARHKRKNGAEDVKKAIHFLELLLELEYPVNPVPAMEEDEYRILNDARIDKEAHEIFPGCLPPTQEVRDAVKKMVAERQKQQQEIAAATEFHPTTRCCGYAAFKDSPYPVMWNPGNQVVQCHNCGCVYGPGSFLKKEPNKA